MRADKKKRLRAAGWKVGGAQEFLGLSDAEAALVELRVALADKLRESRIERHLTQAQVAHGIESSQSRVAKMEAGDPSVSSDLLLRTLFWLGVEYRELAELIAGLVPDQGPRRRAPGARMT